MSVTISSKSDNLTQISNGINNDSNSDEIKMKSPTTANCFWSADSDFEFVSPPEAPVFRPTPEEFAKGPLHYINKIRPLAESHGICKIIPPATFQPPFTVDVEKFRFTPRVQRLNELEAQTRVKLNFLEQIIKYWDLQGATLKIPTVERKILDLHSLHKVVQEECGFETCTRDRKWSRVAAKMGFVLTSHNKGTVASLLRQHYERILYPYDVFLSGATIGPDFECEFECNQNSDIKIEMKEESVRDENGNFTKDPNEIKQEETNIEKKQLRPLRRARRMQGQQRNRPTFQDKELKKLQVYGAGPKMPGILNNNDPTEKSLVCIQCNEDQYHHQLLKCAVCGGLYHCYCLIPPLNDVPKGVWHCARCVAYLVQTQPQPFTHEFGFVQSQRDYSLSEFGEMADGFKRNYFKMPPHSVPLSVVEKEFWRLVGSMEDTVTVEYGADLQTNDYGSGFPTKRTPNLLPSDKEYIENLWNLNNLPVLEGSVFKYMNSNISGMIIPWMYVGMCFSTFCWHNEDHWSYSINYLHWGEAKSWYGVPGEHADTFERAMKRAAPELFNSQPDLLHQLVTICNPNLLMQDGVPIYKTFQQAGEFVVTFPRSYHAGFNQGLNFAEAVNFAPADWLVLGRDCMNHYSSLNRYPVFSHDELICKMACDPDNLDITIASATYDDMIKMVEKEKQLRLLVLSWGVKKSKRIPFELLPDDERQCDVCRTTCFLSALTCPCSEKLVCIEHKENLCTNCKPDEITLKYRYTLDELPTMLDGMRLRREFYEQWLIDVNDALNRRPNERLSLERFKELLHMANKKRFPLACKIYNELKETVEEVEKSSKASQELLERQNKMDEMLNLKRVRQEFQETVCSARLKKKAERNEEQTSCQLMQHHSGNQNSLKMRINTRSSTRIDRTQSEVVNDKLTLEELSLFYDEIESYLCTIPEAESIKTILDRCVDISTRIIDVLKCCTIDHNDVNYDESLLTSEHLSKIIEDSESIAIVTFGKQLEKIKCKLDEVRWLEEASIILKQQVNVDDLKHNQKRKKCFDINTIKSLIETGMSLSSLAGKSAHETLINLQDIADDYEKWIEKCNHILNYTENSVNSETKDALIELDVKTNFSLQNFEQLLEEAENQVTLKNIDLNPNLQRIKEVINKGKEWKDKVAKSFQENNVPNPFVDTYEKLIVEGNRIGCYLDNMVHLSSTVVAVNSWKDKLTKMFFRKSFPLYSLTNILSPRCSQSFVSTFDVNNYSVRLLYQQLKKQSSQTKDNKKVNWFDKLLSANNSHENITSVYKSCIENEFNLLRCLRDKNIYKFDKNISSSNPNYLDREQQLEVAEKHEDQDEVFCATNENENQLKMNTGEVQDCVLKENKSNNDGDLNEKLSLPVSRFCFCDKKASDWMIRCQVCFEWYHQSCVQTFLTTINSTGRGRKNAQQQQQQQLLLKDNHFQRQNFVCMICNRGRRPQFEAVKTLLVSLQKIPCRLMEGELLQCLIERVIEFQEKLKKQLLLNQDLANLYNMVASLKLSLFTIPSSLSSSSASHLKSNSVTIDGSKDSLDVNDEQFLSSPLKNKRKTPLVPRGELTDESMNASKIELSESSKNLLFELLWEANLLEVFIEEVKILWNAWLLINGSYKVAVHIDADSPSSLYELSSKPIPSQNCVKRKLHEENETSERNNDCKKQKRSENLNKRSKESKPTDNKPDKRKNRKGKQNRRTKKSGDDICSMMDKCLKPNGEEVNWVLCEGPCSSWFHQLCAGIKSPEEIESIEKYFCILCKEKAIGNEKKFEDFTEPIECEQLNDEIEFSI